MSLLLVSAKTIKIPQIAFKAFHPDLCYAENKSTKELAKLHYNSQIGIWSFNNRIEPDDAAKLFNYSVFNQLGYFDIWNSSVEHVKKYFIGCGFSEAEFNRFYLCIKRRGVFMHTTNHPIPEVMVEVGRMIARRLHPNRESIDRKVVIPDGLTQTIWPVYPEVADELGLVGDYHFKMGSMEINGIKAFLEFAYRKYSEHGIDPGDLISRTPIPNIDNILSAELKSK